MRLYNGKQHCLILDFVDNCTRNQPVTAPSLLGLDPFLTLDYNKNDENDRKKKLIYSNFAN